MEQAVILSERIDAVRVITLNRPEKLNAIAGDFVPLLNSAIDDADADDDSRAVLIIGAGRAFCAGRDLNDISNVQQQTRRDRTDDLTHAGRHVLALRGCSKPVIAAINGVAVGGGLSIALNADIRLMAEGARLLTGYAQRGLSPDAGMSYILPRLIGLSRSMEFIMSGRPMHAPEAKEIGLVAEVYPDATFREDAMAYAATIASGGPIGLAYSKRLLLESLDNPIETHLRREMTYLRACLQTEDMREGVAAFVEKRAPSFQGR